MKRMIQVLFFVIALTAMLPSCKKTTAVFVPIKIFSTPLQALINSDTSLSVFYALVKKAKDTAMYGGTDSITVLIPINGAFASQGITFSTVSSMSAATADSLLRYYFIPAYDSLTLGSFSFTNKLGSVIYGSTDGVSTYFNGIPAARQSLPGSNAVVFKLGLPLFPAISVASVIASDTTLSYFAEAVKHTNVNLIPASGWNTILAPVDTAFIAAGYATLGSIDSADVATLANILQYHILPGQYFISNFSGLSTVATLQGENINVTFDGNGLVQFAGKGDTVTAGITVSNRISGGNIIIHNISRVLTP
ncbi:MAG: fasciclin domain-containing protein [Bacteroidota bacterium]